MVRWSLLLVHVRNCVCREINKQLESKQQKEKLTAHQWLLIQLYPVPALGSDVFADVFEDCVIHLINNTNDLTVNLEVIKEPLDWSVMVVDETQVLMKKLQDHFLSREISEEEPMLTRRSAFSGLLNGLANVASGHRFRRGRYRG